MVSEKRGKKEELKSNPVLKEQEEKMEALHAGKKEIGWGSQIRSYVLHPYRMVKDLRTNLETGNVDAVLDGELDEFMEAYLKGS